MKFIETDTHLEQDIYFSRCYEKEQLLFFDIETTGFSAFNTKLYFIGCMYFSGSSWKAGQWFNEDGASEQALLQSFIDFAKKYKYLIHFNGDGFDIPYINNKLSQYNISGDLTHLESIDLYKGIKPFKKALALPNLKLKTIEGYLGIERKDTYTGGELIAVYDKYLQTEEETLFQLLLQHNYEDIINMLGVSETAYYKDYFEGRMSDVKYELKPEALFITYQSHLPQNLSLNKHRVVLAANESETSVTVPVYTGEFKYYFENYKDYFYLPIEDTAIHKSVAVYMDKEYRRKATKETCYQRVTGSFLPSFNYPAERTLGKSFRERNSYIETALLTEKALDIEQYTRAILKWIIN